MTGDPGVGAREFARYFSGPVGSAMRAVLDAEISGREHVPSDGPFIVTANHLSLIDPVLVSAAVGRLVRFLALDELFGQAPVLDRLMLYFGAVPISRVRAPLGAMKKALEILDDDDVLRIFPEGARARYWGERPIKQGAAWLSIATGAPIVPCSVIGTEGTLSLDEPKIRIPSVKLAVHPPLEPGSYMDREDPLGSMMDDWANAIDNQIGHWKR